jgi:hypothetical protein
MEALCSFSLPALARRRLTALFVGLFSILVWFWLLRYTLSFFWISPLLPWGLCVVTIALSLIFERQLYAVAHETSFERAVESPVLASAS